MLNVHQTVFQLYSTLYTTLSTIYYKCKEIREGSQPDPLEKYGELGRDEIHAFSIFSGYNAFTLFRKIHKQIFKILSYRFHEKFPTQSSCTLGV